MRRAAAVVFALMAAIGVAKADDERRCVDGHVDEEPAALQAGRVIGAQKRVHFHAGSDKAAECPAATAACAEKAYVVPGDRIVVSPSPRVPGFVCVGYVSRKGTVTAGWLAETAVDVKPASAARASEWIGTWKYLNSTIKITRGKKREALQIEGDSWVQRYQSANVGDIHGSDVPFAGNALSFAMKPDETVPHEKADKTDCALKFARLHDLMIVHDNGNCGGAGVYFTGFYRRK